MPANNSSQKPFLPKGEMYRGLRISFAGFVIALIGVVMAFTGWNVDQRWLAFLGWLTGMLGICVGFVGILLQWNRNFGVLVEKFRAWFSADKTD